MPNPEAAAKSEATKSTIYDFIATAKTPSILKRSMKVAAIVGTVLMMINHGDVLLAGQIESERVLKILLTYMVPFCVSTQASVSATLAMRKSA
ncbi:nitrate/nitrite transporter NrtS [Vibrio mimicus]|uniref:nitrate/nitrite transporter NrtS n=1 Tax=Vibrio mimicus TaxID=674 RepID=UPI0013026CB5|nr:nitrate/nitrite transporter NrtS [Vibrio mimicus]